MVLDAWQNDVFELLPSVRTVDFGRLVQRRIDRHHGADEQNHVLTKVPPDRGTHQGPVVHALILQPVRQVVELEATPLKHGIEYVATSVEELEDEADRDAVDQIREEVDGLEGAAATDLERQHGGQVQGQANLDQRAGHVVKAQLQGGERVGTGEDVDVVLEADEFTRADVLHLVERVADHGSERPVGEDYE